VNAYHEEARDLVPLEFTGVVDKDNFRLEFTKWSRYTSSVATDFLRVSEIKFINSEDESTGVSSMYSGFLGIAPIKQNVAN